MDKATSGQTLVNHISLFPVDLICYPNMVWHVSRSIVFIRLFCQRLIYMLRFPLQYREEILDTSKQENTISNETREE